MSVSILDHEMIIERDGRPLAFIMPYDDYMSLLEKLEDLEDALTVAESKAEYRRDPSSVRSYEEFRSELEEYEELLEELALLSNPEHIRRVAEARAAYASGEGGDYDSVFDC